MPKILQKLITLPHLSQEQRQNANLISGFLLVMATGSLLTNLFTFHLSSLLIGFILLGVLGLCRSRYYHVGIGLTLIILSTSVLTFFSAIETYNHATISTVLAWSIMPVLIASMVLEMRGTARVAAANLALVWGVAPW